MDMIKSFDQLQNKVKEVMQSHRSNSENIPDFSKWNIEEQTLKRKDYLQKVNDEAINKLSDVESDLRIKKNTLAIKDISLRFPKTYEAVLSNEKLANEITKQRAESLATNEKINYSIVNYLKSELEQNNIDFIHYFENAVRLNSSVTNELQTEMNKIFSEVDQKTGLTDLKKEIEICDLFQKQIGIYKEIANDILDPGKKMQLMYFDTDIKKLTSELNPV